MAHVGGENPLTPSQPTTHLGPPRTKRSYDFTDFDEQASSAAYAAKACEESAADKRNSEFYGVNNSTSVVGCLAPWLLHDLIESQCFKAYFRALFAKKLNLLLDFRSFCRIVVNYAAINRCLKYRDLLV